jgi:hypothetical protein
VSPQYPVCGRIWHKAIHTDEKEKDGIYSNKELRRFKSKKEIPEGWTFVGEEEDIPV